MSTKNKKVIKKLIYIGLSLYTTISSEARANAGDHPLEREKLDFPLSRKNLVEEMEKKPKLLFEEYEINSEDETQKDLKLPPMGERERRYAKIKNKIIDKYEKEKPELARFRNSPAAKHHGQTLEEASREFMNICAGFRQEKEEEYKEIAEEEETWKNLLLSLILPQKIIERYF